MPGEEHLMPIFMGAWFSSVSRSHVSRVVLIRQALPAVCGTPNPMWPVGQRGTQLLPGSAQTRISVRNRGARWLSIPI